MKKLIFLLGVLLFLQPVFSQTFKGRVTDEVSGKPVYNAKIELYENNKLKESTLSMFDGSFQLAVKKNKLYSLIVYADSYSNYQQNIITNFPAGLNELPISSIELTPSNLSSGLYLVGRLDKNTPAGKQYTLKIENLTTDKHFSAKLDDSKKFVIKLAPASSYKISVSPGDDFVQDYYYLTTLAFYSNNILRYEFVLKNGISAQNVSSSAEMTSNLPSSNAPSAQLENATAKANTEMADNDGDGLPNFADECPDKPGTSYFNGCPDTDGDGIGDSRDECPTLKGTFEMKGCPEADRDNDGVSDKYDECPDQFGERSFAGCPDTDHDGIPDKQDDCPNEVGNYANRGCPEKKMVETIVNTLELPQETPKNEVIQQPTNINPVSIEMENNGGKKVLQTKTIAEYEREIAAANNPQAEQPALSKTEALAMIEKINTTKNDIPEGKLPIQSGELRNVIQDNTIYYAPGKAELYDAAQQLINQYVQKLLNDPNIVLSIDVHVDNADEASVSDYLSKLRSEKIVNYILKYNIPFSQLEIHLIGDQVPVNDCQKKNCTDLEKQLNRRVVFSWAGFKE